MMKKEVISTLAVLSLVMMGTMDSSALFANQETAQQKEMENYLKTAKAVDIEKGGLGGRNEPWKIFLNDGKTKRKGIFKYIDRPERRLNPVSYKREIAAYELTKLFHADIVPPVVEREISGIKGSLQVMVEDCVNERDQKAKKLEPSDVKAFENAKEEINVFENLTFSARDPKDLLIHLDTWKVCRVDFMEAFDTLVEFLPGTAINRCSRRLYQGLLLEPKIIETAMKPYLIPQEIQGLLKRRIIILEKLQSLIKDKGEAAVLFDLNP